jgi:hypothetical protein
MALNIEHPAGRYGSRANVGKSMPTNPRHACWWRAARGGMIVVSAARYHDTGSRHVDEVSNVEPFMEP